VFLQSPKACANPWSESGDRELELGDLDLPLTGLIGADP
jgi:hypothetical protein